MQGCGAMRLGVDIRWITFARVDERVPRPLLRPWPRAFHSSSRVRLHAASLARAARVSCYAQALLLAERSRPCDARGLGRLPADTVRTPGRCRTALPDEARSTSVDGYRSWWGRAPQRRRERRALPGALLARFLGFVTELHDVAFREENPLEHLAPLRLPAQQELQVHAEVLHLLVLRVLHDRARLAILLDREALLVPADRLRLLDE